VAPRNMMGRHTGTAGEEEPLSDNKPPEEVHVDYARYYRHTKYNSPEATPTLRVEYHCGFSVFKEWVCLEHQGVTGERAARWWRIRAPGQSPVSINEALEKVGNLKVPSSIKIDTSGRYTNVVSHKFQRPPEVAKA
jgi:DNA repair protein RadD